MHSVDLKPDVPTSKRSPFQIHGVLVRVFDTGVLIVGESGTGKSECAFALIRRGHQLVADDVVEVDDRGDVLYGRPTEFTRGLMEIRGLGIVDAASVFGEEALCAESSIDLYVEISEAAAVERFGAVKYEHLLGERRLPKYVFPARAGGGLPRLIEQAVREHTVQPGPSEATHGSQK